jgi:putative ABC transport system ATP-binding protein
MLAITDLTVRTGGRDLLRGFSLDLAAGEMVALRGPSGAGKTSLLRTVAMLQDPGAGRVALDGREPADLGWPAWRRRVALVAQAPAIFPGTVRANLHRPFGWDGRHGAPPADDHLRALLDRLRLADVALDADAERLSIGQQQRVCLVRTLLTAPDVLLLDEPTSALDPDSADAVETAVREAVAARRGGALVVSHDPVRAARWCDRVVDLAAGRGDAS